MEQLLSLVDDGSRAITHKVEMDGEQSHLKEGDGSGAAPRKLYRPACSLWWWHGHAEAAHKPCNVCAWRNALPFQHWATCYV